MKRFELITLKKINHQHAHKIAILLRVPCSVKKNIGVNSYPQLFIEKTNVIFNRKYYSISNYTKINYLYLILTLKLNTN